MPDIPIIGQPDDVLQWYPTTLVRHRCKPGITTILVVTGFQIPVECANCKRRITAMGMEAGDGPGEYRIVLAVSLPGDLSH